jgi:hypothetical protein
MFVILLNIASENVTGNVAGSIYWQILASDKNYINL